MPPWTKVGKRYVTFHQSVILFLYHQEPYYLARTSSISASYIIITLAVIRLPPLSARAFHLTVSELAWKSSTDDAMKAGLVPLQTSKEKLELSLFHNHQSLRK